METAPAPTAMMGRRTEAAGRVRTARQVRGRPPPVTLAAGMGDLLGAWAVRPSETLGRAAVWENAVLEMRQPI